MIYTSPHIDLTHTHIRCRNVQCYKQYIKHSCHVTYFLFPSFLLCFRKFKVHRNVFRNSGTFLGTKVLFKLKNFFINFFLKTKPLFRDTGTFSELMYTGPSGMQEHRNLFQKPGHPGTFSESQATRKLFFLRKLFINQNKFSKIKEPCNKLYNFNHFFLHPAPEWMSDLRSLLSQSSH